MSVPAQLFRICALSAFCCPSLLPQVEVSVRTDKPDYLVGEPVFVFVEVRNIGTEPVGYQKGYGRVDLTVQGAEKKKVRNIGNCFRGSQRLEGGFGGGTHPPQMKPGESVSFQYLLKEYALKSGDYVLHAEGKAGVLWTTSSVSGPNPPPPKHRQGDPIPGEMFDVTLKLTVRDGTEEELRRRFKPYVDDAAIYDWERGPRAREAIAEMAPVFLEKTILGFAEDPNNPNLAVKGLGQIHTAESRRDLMELFDKSADLKLRSEIVRALAEMATPDQLEFFSSLLPGRSTTLDDEIRQYAALGLGQIGGDKAIVALERVPNKPGLEVRAAISVALGNTKSHRAVALLIDRTSDGAIMEAVCGSLASVTHFNWCHEWGSIPDPTLNWQSWWSEHGPSVKLYGPEDCPESPWLLPPIEELFAKYSTSQPAAGKASGEHKPR